MKKIIFVLLVFGGFLYLVNEFNPVGIKFFGEDSLYIKKELKAEKIRKEGRARPVTAKTYFAMGKRSMKNGKYKLAITYFSKAIQMEPLFAEAYQERALAKDKLQDYTGAKKDYETYMLILDKRNKQQNDKIRNELIKKINEVNKKLNDKMYDEAVVDFSNIISSYPKYPEGYIARADTNVLLKKYNEALTDYNKALSLTNIPSIPLYLKAADMQYTLKKYNDAAGNYIQILRLDPEYEYPYYKLTGAYIFIENFEKALDNLKKYIAYSEDKNIQINDFNDWDTILNKYTTDPVIRDLKTNLKSLRIVQYKMP
ncbi:tetratricopeptide repeat protein [Candidatus Ruminimicrobiellum ovillum]|uniref:tetratricopeptide repeat protein n=1 Tax=Candidatus Ruminimicrobiellum ovillum TaxID=1947927 RepID=UPI0035594929